ncbi:MAG: M14 family metallopeptidase [Proteobacteria bacterium]|nr:M14 family metallopeptidase [Pseudomonadota bacterium]
MKTGPDSFSSSFADARARFREQAALAGGVLETIKHPELGPNGADLSTDVARFGPESAPATLVIISGTHGVEGFAGSGAQVDILKRGEMLKLPLDVSVVMIHAINPYGFAWCRRVTHENIDLNRNWIDFEKPLPSNPAYDEISQLVCPSEWSDGVVKSTTAALHAYAAAHSFDALLQAVTGGQYTHPKGIFYGGTGPSWSRITQTAIFKHYLKQSERVGIIDLHTGLGPYGYAEQMITASSESDAYSRACKWFGSTVTPVGGDDSASAEISGDGLSAAAPLLSNAEVTGVAWEFGTQPPLEVLHALRADAWLHAYGDPASAIGESIQQQMHRAFFIDEDFWKGMIVAQTLTAFREALAGLSTQPRRAKS